MTLPALATTTALGERLGESLTGADETRAQAALDDASALIRAEAGEDFTDGEEPPGLDPTMPDIIATVALAAAERKFNNPKGRRSETESLGSYSEGGTYAGSDDNLGSVFLTPAERRLIRQAVGSTSTTVHMLDGPYDVPLSTTGWVPTLPQANADPMPWVTLGDD